MDTDGDYEKSLKHQLELQRMKIEVLERTCANYQQGIKEMNKSFCYMQPPSDQHESVQVYKEMNQALQKTNAELETEKITLQVSITRLHEAEANVRAQLETSEASCASLKQAQMRLMAERNELEHSYLNRLEDKERQLKACEHELLEVKNEAMQARLEAGNFKQLQSEHEQLKQTHEQLSKHYEALYIQTTEIINGIQVLNDQAKENTVLIEDLKTKLVDSRGKVEALEMFNDDLSAQKMTLESKIADLEIKKAEFNQCLNELNVLRAAKFEHDQLVKQLRQYEIEINEQALMIEKMSEAKEFLAENNSLLVTNNVRMKMYLEKLGHEQADVDKFPAIREYEDMRRALEHAETQVRELSQLNLKLTADLARLEDAFSEKTRNLEVELAAYQRRMMSVRVEAEVQTDGHFVPRETLESVTKRLGDEMRLLKDIQVNEIAQQEFRLLQVQSESDRYLAELTTLQQTIRALKAQTEARGDSSTQTTPPELTASGTQTELAVENSSAQTQTEASEAQATQTDLSGQDLQRLCQAESDFSAHKLRYDEVIVRNEELTKMNDMFRVDLNRLTEKLHVMNLVDAQTQVGDDLASEMAKMAQIESTYELVNDWANESDPLLLTEPFETIDMSKQLNMPTPPSEPYNQSSNGDTASTNGTNSCSISQVNINMLESNLNELIENYKNELNQMESVLAQRDEMIGQLQSDLELKDGELSSLVSRCEALEQIELKSRPVPIDVNNNNNNKTEADQAELESLAEKLKAVQQQNLKYKAKLKLLLAENKSLSEPKRSNSNEVSIQTDETTAAEVERSSAKTDEQLQNQQSRCSQLQAELEVRENNLTVLSKHNQKIANENDRLKVLLELKQRFNDQMVRELEKKATKVEEVPALATEQQQHVQDRMVKLESLNSDYLKQIDDLEAQRNLKASQLEEICLKFNEFRLKHSELQQCCDENEKNLREEIQYLRELVEVKKEEIEQLKKDTSELVAIQEESNSELSTLTAQLEVKSCELSRLQDQHAELQQRAEVLDCETQTSLPEDREEIEHLREKLETLQTTNIKYKAKLKQLLAASASKSVEEKSTEAPRPECSDMGVQTDQVDEGPTSSSARASPSSVEVEVQVEEGALFHFGQRNQPTKTMLLSEYETLYSDYQLALKQKHRLEFYLQEKEVEIHELNRELNTIRKSNGLNTEAEGRLQSEIQQLQASLEAKQTLIGQLNEELASKDLAQRVEPPASQELADLREQLVAMETEKKELVETILLKDDHIGQLSSSLRELEAQRGQQIQELQQKCRALEDELERKAERIADLDQQLCQLKATMQSQAEEFENNVRALNEDLGLQSKEKEQHLATLASRENSLTELEEILCQKEDLICTLNSELAEVKSKYGNDSVSAERVVQELNALLEAKEKELDELRDQLTSVRQEYEALRAQDQTSTLDQMVRQLETANELSQELETKLAAALQDKSALEHQLTVFNSKCALFKSKLIELNRQNDTLTTKILAIKAVY